MERKKKDENAGEPEKRNIVDKNIKKKKKQINLTVTVPFLFYSP